MKLHEVQLSPFISTRSPYGYAMSYCIAFAYPKLWQPFIVKGMSAEVRQFIDRYDMALIYITYWRGGVCRGLWQFNNKSGGTLRYYYTHVSHSKHKHHRVEIMQDGVIVKTLYFRRMPRKWIPEFNIEQKERV